MWYRNEKLIASVAGAAILIGSVFLTSCPKQYEAIPIETTVIETTAPHVEIRMEPEKVDVHRVVLTSTNETEPVVEECILTQEEIDLIALVTMAEAEGEPEEGKRLVISTILNRVDHERFPDTVHGVIYQKNAFSSMWDGRADRCYVRDDIVELVHDELQARTDDRPIFFRTGRYSDYGTPMYQVGAHYFSSY